ncbi:MAG: folylpolyglutamate synthase/dihydrofolate synthase family protein [Spirochaetia bacterium]|nr:folylpolyglutamate synthase/dihydrofolate synthase family protein [Spirochaetia bacterium]
MPAKPFSVTDAFQWIESFHNSEKTGGYDDRTYRLERMEELCRLFKDPQKSFKSVHIAGSKGKSSTACYIASILEKCGLKTGLYTSPHLLDYRERISLSGKPFSDGAYTEAVGSIKRKKSEILKLPVFAEMAPTVFELLTLTAFLIFRNEKCDYAVIETGLGGRLDATNVIIPRISVLTPIEKEHVEILGDTLAKIAFEKGGIIKPNIPVQSSEQEAEVKAVLDEIGFRKNSEISYLPDSIEKIDVDISAEGTRFTAAPKTGPTETYTLPNIGEVFARNAALAVLTVRQLSVIDMIETATASVIQNTLASAFIPGRFQIIDRTPTVVIDPAHTPRSVKNTADTFKKVIKGKRILIFAAAKDKNTEEIAAAVGKSFSSVIVTAFRGFKSSDGDRDFRAFQAVNRKTVFEPDPEKALQTARDLLSKSGKKGTAEGGILITGSFYLISRFLKQEEACSLNSFPG